MIQGKQNSNETKMYTELKSSQCFCGSTYYLEYQAITIYFVKDENYTAQNKNCAKNNCYTSKVRVLGLEITNLHFC